MGKYHAKDTKKNKRKKNREKMKNLGLPPKQRFFEVSS